MDGLEWTIPLEWMIWGHSTPISGNWKLPHLVNGKLIVSHGLNGTIFFATEWSACQCDRSNRHPVAVLKETMLASNSARCIWRSTSGFSCRASALTGSSWFGFGERIDFTSQTWRFRAIVPPIFFIVDVSPSSCMNCSETTQQIQNNLEPWLPCDPAEKRGLKTGPVCVPPACQLVVFSETASEQLQNLYMNLKII